MWLAKKNKHSVALKLVPDHKEKKVNFEIIQDAKAKNVKEGTVRRGSATCPICGYTTSAASVRIQLKKRGGGAADAKIITIVLTKEGYTGRYYRLPTENDYKTINRVKRKLAELTEGNREFHNLIPNLA